MNIKILIFLFCFCLLSYSLKANEYDNQFNVADPSYQITFPKDHGPHEQFAIEWWYLTANLKSDTLDDLGIQWTLFKSTLSPKSSKKSRQLNGFWMENSHTSFPRLLGANLDYRHSGFNLFHPLITQKIKC